MKKLALITGINYEGTSYELGGCINDAEGILNALVKKFDFQQSGIQVLIEEVATKKNILEGLERLVGELEPGDVGVFTYSGHGTQTADLPPIGEDDMLDEAIVPIDAINDHSNLIRDDEIHEILLKLVSGAKFVIIADSCHSETLTRDSSRSMDTIKESICNAKNFDEITKIVENIQPKERKISTKKDARHQNDKARYIEPTPTVKRIMKMVPNPNISKRDLEHPLAGPGHILLSGCRAREVSYDDGTNGYFTRALLEYMNIGMTYKELYDLANKKVMDDSEERQYPTLEGPENLTNLNIFE